MSELNIRAAENTDVEELKRLFRETILSINIKHYDEKQLSQWVEVVNNADFLKHELGKQNFFVAEKEKSMYGFASITNAGFVDFVYVHKNHQREGVAQKLYNHLLSFAIDHRFKQLCAYASITAKPFFEQQGFSVISERIAFREKYQLKNFEMCLDLAR